MKATTATRPEAASAPVTTVGPAAAFKATTTARAVSPKRKARAVVGRYLDLLRVEPQSLGLRHLKTRKDQRGMTHVYFRQLYRGVPVEGGSISVHLDASGEEVDAIANGLVPEIRLKSVKPALERAQAVSIARAKAESVARAWLPGAKELPESSAIVPSESAGRNPASFRAGAKLAGRPRLAVYPGMGPERSGAGASLAWLVWLADRDRAVSRTYVIDAGNGRVIDVIDHVFDALDRETYTANHSGDIYFGLPGELVLGEGDIVPGDGSDIDLAYNFAGQTYDYLWRAQGRDSYDGAGGTMRSTVHFGTGYRNAFFILLGSGYEEAVFGDGMVARDIVAHEWTHGVTLHTAGLLYRWQSGALNESFSDIFGAMVDREDWLMGEDSALGAIRSLADPAAYGQPARAGDWVETCGDGYGVHSNSGITNKAFYNVATALGDPGADPQLDPGRAKAERIFFRALTVYLEPDSSLEDARAAAIQAATDLYGEGSAEREATENGFNAVGLDGDWQPPAVSCLGAGTEQQTCAASSAGVDVGGGHGYAATVEGRQGPAWLDPTCVSGAPGDVSLPQVALDGGGNAVTVWDGWDSPTQRIQFSVRPAAGEWTEPANLTGPSVYAVDPQVAMAGHSDAVVAWQVLPAPHQEIQVADVGDDGKVSEPATLSEPGQNAWYPKLAAAGGDAAVAWVGIEPGDEPGSMAESRIYAAVRPQGAEWGQAEPISEPGELAMYQAIAVNGSGDAVAAWWNDDGAVESIQASVRSPGRGWSSTPTSLAVDPDRSMGAPPDVAVDAAGNATAVWSESVAGPGWSIRAASRPASAGPGDPRGGWSEPVDIARYEKPNFQNPQVEIDAYGNAVAVWEGIDYADRSVHAAVRPAGGDWSDPVELVDMADQSNYIYPRLALDGAGSAVAVWSRWYSQEQQQRWEVLAATRPAGADTDGERGGWSEPVALASDEVLDGSVWNGPSPEVALDGSGNSVVTWFSGLPRYSVIKAAALDAAGPALNGLDVPASGVVGEPLRLTVSPVDAWSGTAQAEWSFGDGRAATGNSVTHAYSLSGEYEIAVSAADSLGNTSMERASITVRDSSAGDGSGGDDGQGKRGSAGAPTAESGAGGTPAAPNPAKLRRVSISIRCLRGGIGRHTRRGAAPARMSRVTRSGRGSLGIMRRKRAIPVRTSSAGRPGRGSAGISRRRGAAPAQTSGAGRPDHGGTGSTKHGGGSRGKPAKRKARSRLVRCRGHDRLRRRLVVVRFTSSVRAAVRLRVYRITRNARRGIRSRAERGARSAMPEARIMRQARGAALKKSAGHRRRRVIKRTVLRRIFSARRGANRFVLRLDRRRLTGSLRATISIAGQKGVKRVRVRR